MEKTRPQRSLSLRNSCKRGIIRYFAGVAQTNCGSLRGSTSVAGRRASPRRQALREQREKLGGEGRARPWVFGLWLFWQPRQTLGDHGGAADPRGHLSRETPPLLPIQGYARSLVDRWRRRRLAPGPGHGIARGQCRRAAHSPSDRLGHDLLPTGRRDPPPVRPRCHISRAAASSETTTDFALPLGSLIRPFAWGRSITSQGKPPGKALPGPGVGPDLCSFTKSPPVPWPPAPAENRAKTKR